MDNKINCNIQKPILTIAIPTYNRKQYLKECLSSIYLEISRSNMKDLVEIIISDNASTDGTKEMLDNDYPEIEYHCNSKNQGVEYNVDKCFSYAHGEYTLIFSDDDIILPGALDEIREAIKKKPDFIHLNNISFYKKFKNSRLCSAPRLNLKKNLETRNKNKFFEIVNIYITFLSSSVYKTKLAQAVDRSIYNGSFTSSGQTVLLSMKGEGTYIIIAQPCVAARGGTTGGYSLFNVWVKGYKDLILNTGRSVGFDQKTLQKIYVTTMNKHVRVFIEEYRTREKGLTLENRHYIFDAVKEFPTLWIPLIFATYAPSTILSNILTIRKYYESKKTGK